MSPRYTVCIFGRLSQESPLGSLDVTQYFASRTKAELFARAISYYLPVGTGPRGAAYGTGCVLAWVLVSALHASHPETSPHCYLSYDVGGVEVKRHPIMVGYWGGPVLSVVESADSEDSE